MILSIQLKIYLARLDIEGVLPHDSVNIPLLLRLTLLLNLRDYLLTITGY